MEKLNGGGINILRAPVFTKTGHGVGDGVCRCQDIKNARSTFSSKKNKASKAKEDNRDRFVPHIVAVVDR